MMGPLGEALRRFAGPSDTGRLVCHGLQEVKPNRTGGVKRI
jgi:hypothetical protein